MNSLLYISRNLPSANKVVILNAWIQKFYITSACRCLTRGLSSCSRSPSKDPVCSRYVPIVQTHTRGFSDKILPQTLRPFNKEDNVPEEYEIIYQRRTASHLLMTLNVTIGLIVVASIFVAIIIFYSTNSENEAVTVPLLGKVYILYVSVLLIPMLFYALLGKQLLRFHNISVMRIYRCKDKERYIAILMNGLKSKSQLEFGLKDVAQTQYKRKVMNGNAEINGIRVALFRDDFAHPSYYYELLGYEDWEKEDSSQQ